MSVFLFGFSFQNERKITEKLTAIRVIIFLERPDRNQFSVGLFPYQTGPNRKITCLDYVGFIQLHNHRMLYLWIPLHQHVDCFLFVNPSRIHNHMNPSSQINSYPYIFALIINTLIIIHITKFSFCFFGA